MKEEDRLKEYLSHIEYAVTHACGYIEGLTKEDFLEDTRTQQAVVMNLIIIGESSTKILSEHNDFAEKHSYISWRSMRGMRNRIAHGYFDINLDVVWSTVEEDLPELLKYIKNINIEFKKQ
jgi:uncharacterized protein with HEPN domain